MSNPEMRYPKMDQSAPSSFDATKNLQVLAYSLGREVIGSGTARVYLARLGAVYFGGSGRWSFSFVKARISPPSQAIEIAMALAPKAPLLTVLGSVVLETRIRKPAMRRTLAK
jgi:hypothetical protein